MSTHSDLDSEGDQVTQLECPEPISVDTIESGIGLIFGSEIIIVLIGLALLCIGALAAMRLLTIA